ncbi:hypothetical protein [Chitinophaga sp. XS-30]|uniref:hypothetical protein n=1 Tax=Chitinophaga sp. XS-30 TaxID=2604421 RepID=UPI0011DD4D48|nr:hypothetical protein [Chitinophaga sp. XS-30]QEH42985.1 hypothetical protein FW415_19770 [Chitinophaga sp. XS-30]
MKTFITTGLILLLIGAGSCRKDKKSGPKTTPAPTWAADTTGKYASSMTAVMRLPDDLQPFANPSDKYAAFMKEECRATGTIVSSGGTTLVYFLIQGSAAEQDKISFRYYSTRRAWLFATGGMLDFVADGNHGTVDQPVVLQLKQVE